MTASRRAPSPVPSSTPRDSNQFSLVSQQDTAAEGITLTLVSCASCTFHELTLFLDVPSLPGTCASLQGSSTLVRCLIFFRPCRNRH